MAVVLTLGVIVVRRVTMGSVVAVLVETDLVVAERFSLERRSRLALSFGIQTDGHVWVATCTREWLWVGPKSAIKVPYEKVVGVMEVRGVSTASTTKSSAQDRHKEYLAEPSNKRSGGGNHPML